MPLKSTRQKILDLLSKQDDVSAAEISRALSVTPADVRYHLSRMLEEGLILTAKPRPSGRRGRPARRFILASRMKQDNYALITRAFLVLLRNLKSEVEKKQLLHDIAARIPENFDPAGPLGRRLVLAVEQLNVLNYQARWEAHANAPQVIFDRCPFASLRPEFPELCQLDVELLGNLLDEPVLQVNSTAHQADGYCLFTISQKTHST